MIQLRIKVNAQVDMDKKAKAIGEAVEKGTRQLTQQTYEEWQNVAARRLRTTRRRYQDALSYSIDGPNEGTITLQAKDKSTQWLLNAIENGVGAYSIRDAVLKKAKKKWPRDMSDAQRKAMFAYLKKVGRLGRPPVPFSDVPFRTSGAKEQGRPTAYRRISPNTSTEAWKHPGFKPVGKGGPGPLRDEVVEYVKETAKDVFQPLMARVLA